MKTIYKYPIDITDRQNVSMPHGAILRHVGLDPTGALCLWAEVDTENARQTMTIRVYGTGHTLTEAGRHLGSVTQDEFVWHVYEVTSRPAVPSHHFVESMPSPDSVPPLMDAADTIPGFLKSLAIPDDIVSAEYRALHELITDAEDDIDGAIGICEEMMAWAEHTRDNLRALKSSTTQPC